MKDRDKKHLHAPVGRPRLPSILIFFGLLIAAILIWAGVSWLTLGPAVGPLSGMILIFALCVVSPILGLVTATVGLVWIERRRSRRRVDPGPSEQGQV